MENGDMTGLERMIQKVSNATGQALRRGDRGAQPMMTAEAWSLEELRQAALDQEERRFDQLRRANRSALRWGDD